MGEAVIEKRKGYVFAAIVNTSSVIIQMDSAQNADIA